MRPRKLKLKKVMCKKLQNYKTRSIFFPKIGHIIKGYNKGCICTSGCKIRQKND